MPADGSASAEPDRRHGIHSRDGYDVRFHEDCSRRRRDASERVRARTYAQARKATCGSRLASETAPVHANSYSSLRNSTIV